MGAVDTPGGTRRAPQQARSRRTREAILEAAVACFEADGYEATTTAAIARRARVGVGTVYGYFDDKRAILLELLRDTLDQIRDHIVRELDPAVWRGRDDPRAVVPKLIDAVFHVRTFNPGMQRIVWERYFKDDLFRAAVERRTQGIQDAIAGFLVAAEEEGVLRPGLDVAAASYVIFHSIEWTTSHLTLSESAMDRDAAAATAADMVSRFLYRD